MKRCLLLLSVILLLNNTATAGSLKIDRVWADGDFGYALVSYTNDTKSTFKRAVTIKCTALDENSKKININTRSFFAHEYGPIKPGFEGTLKIPIDLHGIPMKSVSCGFLEN